MKSKNRPKSRSSTIQGINEKIENFCEIYSNLYFLNNKSILLKLGNKKYYIYGPTLWSYINSEYHKEIEGMMNDYSYIYVYNTKENKISKLTAKKVVSLHKKSINKLNK